MSSPPVAGLRCRRITEADLPAVAELLSRGFRLRPKAYWLRGLQRQADRPTPDGVPLYGYLLDNGGTPVGAILLIYSSVTWEGSPSVRCNLSSWYVEPKYRTFGSMLIATAIKDRSVTYFNVSPAPGTWPIVEAQGFAMYCRGELFALPALNTPVEDATVRIVTQVSQTPDLPESDLLVQHAKFGCLSLVIEHGGDCHPFIFQKYRVKRVLPTYRLIYCRDIAEFVRFAGNLGRFLLKRGKPLVLIDANGPVPGLLGYYTEQRGRKYARGPHAPKLGDLAFSEGVFFNT